MKLEEMSDKTLEVHAEFCLKFCLNISTAIFISVLITPLTIIVGQILGKSGASGMIWAKAYDQMGTPLGYAILLLLTLSVLAALYLQQIAYKSLNALHPSKQSTR